MEGLGDLAGGNFQSRAEAISDDGLTIVGRSQSANGNEAFRWTSEDGMVGLGDLPGVFFESKALAVSADGSTIVGSGDSDTSFDAFVWTESDGMQSLFTVLTQQGDDLSHWQGFHSATGISDDGTKIVGIGFNTFGNAEAFVATINTTAVPEPIGLAVGSLLLLTMLLARRRKSITPWCSARSA